MNIGQTLTELRKKQGVSRQEFADEFGISVHTYIKYENGSVNPPYETLLKLANFYGVTTDYLLGREEQPNPLATLNVKVDDDKFIATYQKLPDYAKQIFIDTMSKLTESAKKV